ncbi:MAG: hypothetical protein J7J65_03675 [Candidatus Korarchaeota archaeon]|nr:hypothetical protein [Candidatus Korarchaeota archaeon]
MNFEEVKFRMESLSNQITYLFFKIDEVMRKLRELELKVEQIEKRMYREG